MNQLLIVSLQRKRSNVCSIEKGNGDIFTTSSLTLAQPSSLLSLPKVRYVSNKGSHNNINKIPNELLFQCHRDSKEMVQCTSHNAMLSMGYFVQEVMWGNSDETYLSNRIQPNLAFQACCIKIAPHDQLYNISHLKAMHCGKYTIPSLGIAIHPSYI